MKKKIRQTLREIYGLICKNSLNVVKKIPPPAFGRLGNQLQIWGVGQLTAASIGLIVSSSDFTVSEMLLVSALGLLFLACGTIMDVKSCK